MTQKQAESTPWHGKAASGQMHRIKAVCQRTGLSRSTIYKLMGEGLFPPALKLGSHASAVPDSWLTAYLEQQGQKALATLRVPR